jgi:hypothetical protein
MTLMLLKYLMLVHYIRNVVNGRRERNFCIPFKRYMHKNVVRRQALKQERMCYMKKDFFFFLSQMGRRKNKDNRSYIFSQHVLKQKQQF